MDLYPSTGLVDPGVYPHFCDTRESSRVYGGVSVWEALAVVEVDSISHSSVQQSLLLSVAS